MKKSNKIILITAIIPGLISGVLIGLLFSGKIINIPKGTHQGGIIAGTGVGVIMLTIFVLTLIFKKIFNN